VSVYVLQHPKESQINKGNASIAKMSLKNYKSWQGEDFSSHEGLNQLINSCTKNIAVIYPSEHAVSLKEYQKADSPEKTIEHVIFIDATWRKAKKIWSLSPSLHTLPCIKLDADNKSNYRIRKVPAEGYLSTVEAITDCLSGLEEDEEKYKPMLNIID